jgi:hypothetical protein
MAFYRSAFENIGGFDTEYHRAGDDVDFAGVCNNRAVSSGLARLPWCGTIGVYAPGVPEATGRCGEASRSCALNI